MGIISEVIYRDLYWSRREQEWIRTTEGVKPADLQTYRPEENSGLAAKKRPKPEPGSTHLDNSPLFFQLGLLKDWPRIRKAGMAPARCFAFTQAGQEQLKQSYKKLIGLTQGVKAQAAAVLVALKDHQLVARTEAFLKVMAAERYRQRSGVVRARPQ